MKSLLISLILSISGPAVPVATSGGYEQLPGFPELLGRQIETQLTSARLPRSTGYPVEPGVYVTLTPDKMYMMDREVLALKEGRLQDRRVARACTSPCSFAFYAAFSDLWFRLKQSAKRSRYDHPTRILWAVDQDLPASTWIDSLYSALETWPRATPPSMYLLANAGPGGVRARHFEVMPPQSTFSAQLQSALELRVRVSGQERYQLSARASDFPYTGSVQGRKALQAKLRLVKQRYPGKEVIVVEAQKGATVQDLAWVMGDSLQLFPHVIVDSGVSPLQAARPGDAKNALAAQPDKMGKGLASPGLVYSN